MFLFYFMFLGGSSAIPDVQILCVTLIWKCKGMFIHSIKRLRDI